MTIVSNVAVLFAQVLCTAVLVVLVGNSVTGKILITLGVILIAIPAGEPTRNESLPYDTVFHAWVFVGQKPQSLLGPCCLCTVQDCTLLALLVGYEYLYRLE